MPEEKFVTLPTGIAVKAETDFLYDWDSIRVLAEAGVPYSHIAQKFKGLSPQRISDKASQQNWITPCREKRMKREILRKQREALAKTGEARELTEVVEEIWVERASRVNEKVFAIAESALDHADTKKVAETMIEDATDLEKVVKVARVVTGQEVREKKEEAAAAPSAVNLTFLRSAGVQPQTIDV